MVERDELLTPQRRRLAPIERRALLALGVCPYFAQPGAGRIVFRRKPRWHCVAICNFAAASDRHVSITGWGHVHVETIGAVDREALLCLDGEIGFERGDGFGKGHRSAP